MKVLHFVDENRLSWAEPWMQTLQAQRSMGCENIVLCRPGGTLSRIVEDAGFPCFCFNPFFASVPVFCRGMEEILKKIQPELVHTRLSSASAIAGYWTRKMRLPLVSTVDKFAKGKYYKRADCLVAVSGAVASHCKNKGFSDAPVKVIPNSIDLERYQKSDFDRNEFRDQNGVDRRRTVILGAGRFVPWKGFDVLIESAALVSKSHPVELWLAGTGPEQEKLEILAKERSVSVKFWGFVGDIRPLMWSSDIFVLPSRDPEPFGLVLLEAMACGLPVFATRAGGPLDMMKGMEDQLFALGNCEELAFRINKMLSDGSRQYAGSKSSENARAFSSLMVARSLVRLYAGLLSGEIDQRL